MCVFTITVHLEHLALCVYAHSRGCVSFVSVRVLKVKCNMFIYSTFRADSGNSSKRKGV